MADIEFYCVHCGGHLVVDSRGAGKTVPCPTCNQQIIIPGNATKPPPTARHLTPPALPQQLRSSNKRHLWLIICSAVVLFVFAALILLFVITSNQKQTLWELTHQQYADGWYFVKWGMTSDQVENALMEKLHPLDINDSNKRAYLGSYTWGEKNDIFFHFFKDSGKLSTIQISINKAFARSIWDKARYDWLRDILIEKYAAPDEMINQKTLEGNRQGITRATLWEKTNECYISLIERSSSLDLIYEPTDNQGESPTLFNIMMENSHRLYQASQSTSKAIVQNSKAEKYYETAQKGDAESQYRLARCYHRGDGAKKNDAESVVWYRKAADLGYGKAQLELARAYLCGVGLKRDCVEAVNWYRKAAEQGIGKAQHELGCRYLEGEQGVSADKSESVKWFLKAAKQNFVCAQEDLGMCYEQGWGLQVDIIEAYKWYYLAAAKREPPKRDSLLDPDEFMDDPSISPLGSGTQQLVRLANKMTPEQIKEAQRRAAEFAASMHTAVR